MTVKSHVKLSDHVNICYFCDEAPALKKANIGVAVADATDAARAGWHLIHAFFSLLLSEY